MSEQNKFRILIIDDDSLLRTLMRDLLSEYNYIISEVDNGFDAIKAIKNLEPDMVLLDVNMPKMSGFEVCSEIRKLTGDTNISVIMVTGLNDAVSIEKSFQVGATAFISKPINLITFPHQIQYFLKARNALVTVKQREKHLGYMEKISSIITQNKEKDVVLQEAMFAMLDIFKANRAFIISSLDMDLDAPNVICEAASNNIQSIKHNEHIFLKEIRQANVKIEGCSKFPLVSSFSLKNISQQLQIHHQMLITLQPQDHQPCLLVLHKCTDSKQWTQTEQETFNDIGSRLNAVLSNFLLMKKLRLNEHLLRQAQHLGHLGNWHWDVKKDKLIWSDEIYNIYGHTRDNFTPTFENFYNIVFKEDVHRLTQFRQIIFNTTNTHSIEHRIRLPNNEIRWVHEQGIGKHDSEGNLIEVSGTVQDITDRIKKQEHEVHEQKMKAIGQLTSGLAHDFGNLMTVAKGNLELLNESLTDECNISTNSIEMLVDAHSAIHDSVELIKQLLSFSRKKSISPEYINVNATITKFKKLLKNSLGEKTKLSIKIQNDLPDIRVDPAKFESALLNATINAHDAMPIGGKLKIHAEVKQDVDEQITQNSDNDISNHCVKISITDNGTGMTSDVLQHAIEPFFTTKQNSGTGLGLSMIYGFLKQSRGELIIESHPDNGTCLTMLFPIYGGKKSTKTEEMSQISLTLNAVTILVVDDRPDVRQFAIRCLNNPQFNILEAKDAASARKLLENSDKIDLLFTDILMPGDMNGRELAAWAIRNNPQLKILLTTASEKAAQQQSDEQNFPWLQKPYSKQALIKKILSLF